MSSLTRDNIDELVNNHGLRAGYELKVMGKDDVIKGVQFTSSSSSNTSNLPSKRSIVNGEDALNKLEKELLVNFGKRNRRDSAERIVDTFNSLKERFLLPEGISASVQSLDEELPTLNVSKDDNEIASLTLDDWPILSNSTTQKSKPYFAPQLEEVMLSLGADKHSVDIEFSLPLDWSDQSDEDGYSFAPNLADEDLVNEINESIKIEVAESIIGDMDLDPDFISNNIELKIDVASDAEIEEVDFDEQIPSNIRLRHKTVDDMPGAKQEFIVKVLMSPEFPTSPETLGLIKDSVKDLLISSYGVNSDDITINIKQSTKGMPLRGLKTDLKQAFEQALSQYSILEPEQKSNKLNDVVKKVIGYTAPVISAQHLSLGPDGADAEKLTSIVECSIEEGMLAELAPLSSPELKINEGVTDKLEQRIDNDVHAMRYNKNLMR
jgi:hypothetical protein